MKHCVSQCSLGRVPHDSCHTTRIRQGDVDISREGRAHSPQIIISFEKTKWLQIHFNPAKKPCFTAQLVRLWTPRALVMRFWHVWLKLATGCS
jgi:hypothetical protein